MPVFTIETTYRIPVYRQRRYEANSLAEACRLAIEDDDWDGSKQDYECAGETHVTGAWPGAVDPYSVPLLTIASQFGETIQRKADHFDVLLAQLSLVAQPMGLSAHDFERWLPVAQSAVRTANAIIVGARDSDDIDTDERREGIIAFIDRSTGDGREAVIEDVEFDDDRIHGPPVA